MKNVIAIVSMLAFSCFILHAQELPAHPRKVYISPEGKIYFNKSLPVYFYVSTSTDPNAPRYRLTSESTPKYTNPMYFDTEGKNTLRSPFAVDTITKKTVEPKIDVQFQVYVDSKPPKTRIIYNKPGINFIKGIYYVPDSVTVTFNAIDEMSGVENTYVSINKGAFEPVINNLQLDKEQEYTLRYYSVDHTGNVEQPKEIEFSVDKTPPISNLNVIGDQYENILSGKTYFEIAADDKLAGVKHIYFSIDDSVFRPYTGKISSSLIKQGEHKIFYYATDEVNHAEKIHTYAFYIDKTPPQVIEEILGKTFNANGKEFSAGTSKLKITAFDNKAGVKEIYYSINKTPYIKYEKPVILSGYKGSLLVTSYAIDNVGNQSQSDVSDSRKNSLSYIDLSGPWVGHSFKGPNYKNGDTMYINQKTNIILEAKDSESGINRIEYQTDSSDLKKYTSPITLEKEGYHHISIFGYDNTENLTRQEFGVIVDTTGPEIFNRFSSLPVGISETDGVKLEQYSSRVVVFLSATDTKAGYETILYALNGGVMQPYTREIKGFAAGKKNSIQVRAIDKLGNQTEKLIEFYIK